VWAIVELKAVEHPVFLLQAAKYWLPIRRHLEQADFPRYGYFSSVALQANPPLAYLVAPGLRFHPVTEILLRYLPPPGGSGARRTGGVLAPWLVRCSRSVIPGISHSHFACDLCLLDGLYFSCISKGHSS